MEPILPPVDSMPLPGPVGLFRALHAATFLLHLLAMNLLMGGGILAAISLVRGKANAPYHRRLSDRFARMLPIFTAATITLGVAPLLFMQVLYGRFFYTSSILIAIPWFLVIALLIAGYYGHYFISFSDRVRRERFVWVAWISALFVVLIGFIYTNNLALMETPGRFFDMYVSNRTGLRLNLSEPTLVPRFLHFFFASLAVAGMAAAFFGQRETRLGEREAGRWMARYGAWWFAGATAVQILDGFWYLFALPATVRDAFLGGNAVYTAHLFGAAFLALVAAFLMIAKSDSRPLLRLSAGLLALAVVAMVMVRHWVREMRIGEMSGLADAATRTQWSVLVLFLILFLGALFSIGWMLRRWVVEGRGEAREIE